jgi:hypothetical protein
MAGDEGLGSAGGAILPMPANGNGDASAIQSAGANRKTMSLDRNDACQAVFEVTRFERQGDDDADVTGE